MDTDIRHQIVDEQLAFPSGTATAQLISVLHQIPPPDTSVRRRHGYRELDGEDVDVPTIETESLTAAEDDIPMTNLPEVGKTEGWMPLTWSFFID